MNPLKRVRFLTVREVAEQWTRELRIPQAVIERELRIALYKIEIEFPFDRNIDIKFEENDLPGPEVLIEREFINRFVGKQDWKLPAFWFRDLPEGPRPVGRPSNMNAIVQELRRRHERRALAPTISAQARELEAWA